jgi:SAM-dependent MidA family methyltransferase
MDAPLPFERFMRDALYHPQKGYYSRRIRGVGRRGDFSTWATLDDSLARAIAGWIRGRGIRRVIEVGAGDGSLARAVLRHLGGWRRVGLRYHIVEVSAPLRELQRKRLSGCGIVWHESPREALRGFKGSASIFSNELPDAFPCRVFEKQGGEWLELCVSPSAEGSVETLQPCLLPESTVFGHAFREGCRVEVHESYRRWLEEFSPEWTRGEMLTIDYGDTMPGLYHRRPAGTLRAYIAHQMLAGSAVFEAPGTRDLTADVNFSDLEAWGVALGWQTVSQGVLGEFFGAWTPGVRPPAGFEGAATAFRFLEQRVAGAGGSC